MDADVNVVVVLKEERNGLQHSETTMLTDTQIHTGTDACTYTNTHTHQSCEPLLLAFLRLAASGVHEVTHATHNSRSRALWRKTQRKRGGDVGEGGGKQVHEKRVCAHKKAHTKEGVPANEQEKPAAILHLAKRTDGSQRMCVTCLYFGSMGFVSRKLSKRVRTH